MNALEVAGLALRRDGREILTAVSFAAARGERLVLMGPSGTGKTTVLRAIAGLDRPSAGSITIHGVAGEGDRPSAMRSGIGMVFQSHYLFAHLTALQNVWLAPVHVLRRPQEEAEHQARLLLEKLGVGHRASALPHELSGGEAQRVAIARALAVNPPVLLLDEPTASLDPARRSDLAATLRTLSDEGTTLVIATHDLEFARACADRVLVMDGGRIAAEKSPAELVS